MPSEDRQKSESRQTAAGTAGFGDAQPPPVVLPKLPPVLRTERFVLRPYAPADAPALSAMMNDFEVIRWTYTPVYPYDHKAAEEFIAGRDADYAAGRSLILAAIEPAIGEEGTAAVLDGDATRRERDRALRVSDGTLVGAIGLRFELPHGRAEVGYNIARSCWGEGIATEITRAVVGWSFKLGLVRIHAGHYGGNAASGRVLEKAGMTREGEFRKHVLRFGYWHDVTLYGILREEWERQRRA